MVKERRNLAVTIKLTGSDLELAHLAEKKLSSIKLPTSTLLRELILIGARTVLGKKK